MRRLALILAIVALVSSSLWITSAGSALLDVTARGSVGQVAITGADPGAVLELIDGGGRTVARGKADAAGALLLRDVAPGTGYRVVATDGGARSEPLRVLRPDDPPPASFYRSQQLDEGYQYLTTRDGTQLAVNVRLPGPVEDGPYPTVVEYSGYDPANPDGIQAGMRLAETLGYATVGVNMRGTGCSGGAWEYFEPLQALDGYDAIEIVAAQPWVAHGHVGMVGISYSGIAQLFVAASRPPHLAAITPLSVISDTYRGVLYPGGILNTGFAVSWAEDRQSDSEPAPDGGQRWARRRVAEGDATCAANQQLRAQTPDVLDEIRANAFYTADRLDHVTPTLLVDRIAVPTFLAGAWQDEQTGGYWPAMIERFSPDIPLKVTMANGTHSEPFGPDVITRWAEFLDFYVARRVPTIPPEARATAAVGYTALAGVPLELPPDRFAGETDYDDALARYEAEPPIRVLFDNGTGAMSPGAPVAAFEASLPAWPPATADAAALYLGPREGEILVRTDEASREFVGGEPVPVDEGGWFATGDVGRIDDGILFITGRVQEKIIVGGFNVYPAEVEDVARRTALVRDAVVVALPDDRLGEVPVAGIVWAGEPDEAALLEVMRDELAHYKVPRALFALDAVPLTARDKVDRRRAAELAQAALGASTTADD